MEMQLNQKLSEIKIPAFDGAIKYCRLSRTAGAVPNTLRVLHGYPKGGAQGLVKGKRVSPFFFLLSPLPFSPKPTSIGGNLYIVQLRNTACDCSKSEHQEQPKSKMIDSAKFAVYPFLIT